MRYFYISDEKDIDATVVSVTLKSVPSPELVFEGKTITSVRVLESTDDKSYSNLKKKYGKNLADSIIKNDADIEFRESTRRCDTFEESPTTTTPCKNSFTAPHASIS